MKRTTWWAAVLALAGAAAPASAKDDLKWKLKEKDTFYITSTRTTQETLTLMGRAVKREVKIETESRFKVKKVGKEGTVLEQEYTEAKVEQTGDLEPAEKTGLGDMGERLKGATFTITLNPAGKVTKVEGYEDLIKKLTKDNKDAGKLYRLIYPEETFRRQA